MATLFDEIKHCTGQENCWGEKNPKCRKPVVLPCKQQPEVMIVTEQMNVHKKELKKNLETIPENWEPSKELLDFIKEAKEGKRKIGIIPKINELFNGKFLEDFDTENRSFNKFYWTHFIKCPGNVRNRNFKRGALDIDICAETFLPKEIKVLRPET